MFPPDETGDVLRVGEIADYLDGYGIAYDRNKLEMMVMDEKEAVYYLGTEVSVLKKYSMRASSPDVGSLPLARTMSLP